jgi:hypothetical protein
MYTNQVDELRSMLRTMHAWTVESTQGSGT